MSEIAVTWEWESISPLHLGSGLSRLGVADSLVQRDPSGNPIIYGDAVKGALRMGAEQVAAWLGASQHRCYAAQGTAEPRSWPLARLFGGQATARCTPAALVDDDASSARSQVVASTAIDRTTGTADDQTLRKIEVVRPGLRFRASYTATVGDSEADVVETLLLAALTSVESIGGRAGIGWGRVTLGAVCVTRGGVERPSAEAVAQERLERLRDELGKPDPAPASPAIAPVGASPNDQRWFKLTVTLDELTCLPDAPEISNKVTTNDWIAATTLRGALAGYWRRSGRAAAQDVLAWLSEETAWTPAFRVVGDSLAVPAPRSFVTTKRALGAARAIHDTLAGPFPTAADGSALQWRSMAGDAVCERNGKTTFADGGMRQTRMHVARDYRTGGKRSGALYARESLVPKTTFVAWARVPKSAFPQSRRSLTLLVGKRVSAGNGRATAKVDEVDGPSFGAVSVPAQPTCEVVVHLVSPAIVYDDHGHPRRTLDHDWWSGEFDPHATILASAGDEQAAVRTAPGRRGGWMTNWGHGRAAVTTIDAGSVWRLQCNSPADADALRTCLRKRGHLGERAHEGFGWIAVDPLWLVRPTADSDELPDEAPAPPNGCGTPVPWPGTGLSARILADIARRVSAKMEDFRMLNASASALQEVAARLRVGQSINDLKKLCSDRAKKKKDSKWTALKEILLKPEDEDLWGDAERMQFALSVLISRAGGSGQ